MVAHVITKADIAALRKADSIVFRHSEESHLNCILRASDSNPFEQSHDIPCETLYRDYSSGEMKLDLKDFVAFDMIHTAKYDAPFQTFASLVKEGDIIALYWLRGAGNTTGLGGQNFYCDRLNLQIRRADKRLDFHMCYWIGPDNTARMTRRRRER